MIKKNIYLIPHLNFHQHRDPIRRNHNDNNNNTNESSKDNSIHRFNIQQNESGN